MESENSAAEQQSSTGATSASQASDKSSVRWGGIALFLALTFGISWSIWLGLGALGVPFGIRTAIGMFGPALAAVLVRGPLHHDGFADAGLGLGRRGAWRMYVAAYGVPPLLIVAGICLSLLIGYQHWVDPVGSLEQILAKQLQDAHRQLPSGSSLHELAQIGLIVQITLALTIALAINMIFTFGEEFGWRGYLLPRLAPLGGSWAALITGVIWGLWHAPVIMLNGFNFPGHPWLGILGMVLFTTAVSFIFAWLRFRSGSVWPSTLAHAAINAQAGITVLVLAPAGDSLLRPPVGLIGVVPIAVLALVLVIAGQLRPGPISAIPSGATSPGTSSQGSSSVSQ